MNKAELQAKWPTFKFREEPDPECTSCQGTGERRTNVEHRPLMPCWCVTFSRDFYKDAREIFGRVAKRELAALRAGQEP